jgi:anti-sigma factor RsiW
MDHRDAWELLPDVAAGCCAQDERLAVEAHVRTCEACAAELDALRRAHAVLTTAGPPPTAPATW